MKTILFSLTILLGFTVFAAQEADYVVPVPKDLADLANFKVKIVQPYAGDTTEAISYTFPEDLTGTPPLTVTLRRVAGTENSWESQEMRAECSEQGDLFTCNMFLNRKPAVPAKMVGLANVFGGTVASADPVNDTYINKESALAFISNNSVSAQEFQQKKDILDWFLSSEPAGVLSYHFTPYPVSTAPK